ncbi:MAG TPA: carboxypeptidase-like regulatory domain-containing protein [Ktedonobacteraceae bacterium]|nr:carboxypeptidase-like regulatory domain-containing protein [Ktedonobacteraceae bacterium]
MSGNNNVKPMNTAGRDRIYRVRLRVAPTLGRCTQRGPILETDAINTVPTTRSGSLARCCATDAINTVPTSRLAFLARSCAVTLIGCIFLFLFPFSTVSAHTFAASGRIFGQLLDGTKNNTPVAGQAVTLQLAQGETAQDFATATTDAQGAYSFDNLRTDKTISYAVYIRYQGAQYVSNVVSLDSKPVQQVNLTVYEATTSTAKVAVVQTSILLHEPDAQIGMITVSEFFFFKNLDTSTYVGSLDASHGKPNALLFSLPPGARNVSLSNGFDGYKVIQVDRGFATDAALPPGDSQFAFSFEVPYTASSYDFAYTVMYPTVQLSVMVPPDIHAASSTLTSQGVITADQHPYHLFKASQLLANQDAHLQLEGLPVHKPVSAPSALNTTTVWLVVALLIMLAILVVTWFLLRPYQRKDTKQQTRSRARTATKGSASTARDREQALLQELLELDKAFEAGKLSKAAYHERRAKTKARLRAILHEQEVSR